MKTITEFNGFALKNAVAARAGLTQEGKTTEEVEAGLGEKLKMEGDKLKHLLTALATAEGKIERVKRVVVLQLAENEKGPHGAVEKEGHAYVLEFFPEPPRPEGKGAGRDDRGGGRDGKRGGKKGGKGGRDGRGGGRGDKREAGGGGRRDDRGAGGGNGPGRGAPRLPKPLNTPVAAPAAADSSTPESK